MFMNAFIYKLQEYIIHHFAYFIIIKPLLTVMKIINKNMYRTEINQCNVVSDVGLKKSFLS